MSHRPGLGTWLPAVLCLSLLSGGPALAADAPAPKAAPAADAGEPLRDRLA